MTSFTDVFWEATARACVETACEQNPEYELRAYVEAGDAGRLAEMVGAIRAVGGLPIPLAELPLLGDFLALARDIIPESLGGDAPESAFACDGPASGDVWFRKHMFRWFRKIVALCDAAADFDGVLFWLDCDCRCVRPLPRTTIERTFAGSGVIHMRARRGYSETGLVGYDLGVPGVPRLIEDMRDHYMRRAFVDLPRWDDCITLDMHLAKPGAPASRDIARRVTGHGDVLPSTPFGSFIEHDKGRHSRGLGLVK